MGNEGVLSPGRGYGFSCWGGTGLNQDAHPSTLRPPTSDPAKAGLCRISPLNCPEP